MPSFSRSQILSTVFLTGGCLAVYFGLRAAPVEPCEFMHYGDYVNHEGVIEGCGYEEVGFFDLDAMRFPIIAEIKPLTEVTVGEPATFQLTLQTSTGRPISYRDLAVSHTERLHAMAVDQSLADYQHFHPEDAGAPGCFLFTLTPQKPGPYSVYLDCIPLQTSRRAFISANFQVAGDGMSPTAPSASRLAYDEGDFSYRLALPEGQAFGVGRETSFSIEVKSKNGQIPKFEPVMDSFAHVVAFAPDRHGFAHFHPQNPFVNLQDPTNPDLDFVFSVDQPGYYRVWAQMAINGEERYIPFDLQVN
jgi:hypothetical protein